MKHFFIVILVIFHIAGQSTQLYTCGMHPNVIQEQPGTCPICEMDLTPIKTSDKTNTSKERKILYWRAPMNPQETYDKPGKSKMGMDLVPVYSDEIEGTSIKINPTLQQNMGVRIYTVKSQPLIKEINTTGFIQFDETRKAHITLKVDGWVEKLYTNFTGQPIKKGEPLLELYSPEVINAQQEYLSARSNQILLGSSGTDLVQSANARLDFWGVSNKTLQTLIKKGRPLRTVQIVSPVSGVITKKNIEEGHFAKQGATIFEVADLSKVWLMIDIYEKDLPFIAKGQSVFATLPYNPHAQFSGKIDYIYPILDKKTRSVKARVVLHNPNEQLKVNMFANAKISSDLGTHAISIPSEAVIRTGKHARVIIANEDDTFTPRNVVLGYYFNDHYQVVSGLSEGEKVVGSSKFLIDSESKLKEAIQKLISEKRASKAPIKKPSGAEISIKLPSIQCGQCIETITEALEKSSDIYGIEISLETKTATINYNASAINQENIETLITESGYHANMRKRATWAYDKLPMCCKED